MSARPGIGDYIHGMVMEATKLLDELEQAAKHNAEGEEQWACNLVALTHYKLGQLSDARADLLGRFEAKGIMPGAM